MREAKTQYPSSFPALDLIARTKLYSKRPDMRDPEWIMQRPGSCVASCDKLHMWDLFIDSQYIEYGCQKIKRNWSNSTSVVRGISSTDQLRSINISHTSVDVT